MRNFVPPVLTTLTFNLDLTNAPSALRLYIASNLHCKSLHCIFSSGESLLGETMEREVISDTICSS